MKKTPSMKNQLYKQWRFLCLFLLSFSFFNVNAQPTITCPGNLSVECGDSTDPTDTGMATAVPGTPAPTIWINEIHYDNAGTDVGEFVEIAGTAGFDLSNCRLYRYNGSNGNTYGGSGGFVELTGAIDDEGMGYGAVQFNIGTLQNGSPDGLALTCDGVLIQFISYEGAFVAAGNMNYPAFGMMSTDIGVSEPSSTPIGESLQLTGMGAASADFSWQAPAAESPGQLNAGQSITMPTVDITFSDMAVANCGNTQTINRTWTATDSGGGQDVCTQIITITDTTPPMISCPADVVLECSDSTAPSATGEATGMDACLPVPTPTVWINEFHYDNSGTDVNEFVEVAGTAGFDLSSCAIYLYNGTTGGLYNSNPPNALSGVIDDEGMGYGAVSVLISPIQNGANTNGTAADGLALVCNGTVIQFISYEGVITANNGPAAGMTSMDVGVLENGSDPAGNSLQLEGMGSMYGDFTWAGPVAESPGTLNANQTIVVDPNNVTISFNDVSTQGAGCSAYSYTIFRTWTATDGCGNMATCTQMITVEDNNNPVIICPADVTVECDQPTTPATTGMATGTDLCANPPQVWINEIHYDNTGGDVNEFVEVAGTAGFDLSTCAIYLYNGSSTNLYNSNPPNALSGTIDDEGMGFGAISLPIAPIQNGMNNAGTDADGLALVCNGVVVQFLSYEGVITAGNGPAAGMTSTDIGVLEDGTNAIGTSLQLEGSGNTYAAFSWAGPLAESPGTLNAGQTIMPNTALTIAFTDVTTQTPTGCTNDSYTITRTWTATDPCGNMAACDQIITVTDNGAPTIVCPADVTIACDEDTAPANTGMAVGLDDCAATAEIVIDFSDVTTQTTTGCGQYQYEITRTWTATDPCGNNTSCIQMITVEDNTPPTIVCPADVNISCSDSTDPANNGTATAMDNCAAVAEVTISSSDVTTQTNEGCGQFTFVINRTWLATDACGNTATCVQTISVADTEAPVITCLPNQTLTCFETIPTSFTNAEDFIAAGGTISDNCTSNLADFTVFAQNDDNGGDNCPGNGRTVVRTYFVADACGNVSTCEQTFTYLESTQGPVITSVLPSCFKYCASLANPMETDITYETDCSFGATVAITGPTQIGADNCPGSIYRYTYTVTDDCGRTSAPVTRDFIIGNDGPTISCAPFNLILECGDPNNQDYIDAHLAVVDANTSCELGYNINYFPQNFNLIACGSSTVVTFVATDDCGRTATCTTTIAVQDNTAPTFTAVPPSVCDVINCSADVNYWYNHWIEYMEDGLEAEDACDTNVSIQAMNTPVNTNCPDGTAETIVNFVATDNCGNTAVITGIFVVEATPSNLSMMGRVATEENVNVENVSVTLEGNNNILLHETADDGIYTFEHLTQGQNYSVTPYLDENPLNGVSSYDLVLISKHILQLETLDSPYKIIAADINHSGSITTSDLVELRKLILHIDEEFEYNTSWRFVESNFVFPENNNPFATLFPEEIFINGLTEDEEHDFVAVKIGDVNNSVIANGAAGIATRNGTEELIFSTVDLVLEKGKIYQIPVHSENFTNIHGYQYTIQFDADALEFLDAESGALNNLTEANFGFSLLEKGVVTTSWTNTKAQSLLREAAVFHLNFEAKANGHLSEFLRFNSDYTKAEAYNNELDLMNVDLRFERAQPLSKGLQLYPNIPNPFSQETVIGFDLPEAGEATLSVYDLSGRLLESITGDFEKGYNRVVLTDEKLVKGLMHYQLRTEFGSLSGRMVME